MLLSDIVPLWVVIISVIGIILGFFSSIIVMASLIKLPFKDVSTELRKYATISDILLTTVFGLVFVASNKAEFCAWNFFINLSFDVHALWIFYMSYLMRKIIYLKQKQEPVYVKWAYAGFLSIAAGVAATLFTRSDLCLLGYDIYAFYYELFTFYIPNILILLLVLVFYRDVRGALIIEINKCDEISKEKRTLFVRIYGYPIIFFIPSVHSVLTAIGFLSPHFRLHLDFARLIILSYYPLLNSMFYGLTQSSRRALKYIISKDFDYDMEENILNELRNEEYILPRFYLDLIDQPEDQIFK